MDEEEKNKMEDLVHKLTKSSERGETYALFGFILSFMSFVPAIYSYGAGSPQTVILIATFSAVVVTASATVSFSNRISRRYDWYRQIVNREGLKITSDLERHVSQNLDNYGKLYCRALRIQRDIALVEERRELAQVLGEELKKCIEKHPGS